MEKINLVEILKDCPKGMELDCALFDTKVIYQGLSTKIPTHPIVVQTEHGFEFELTQYGQTHNIVGSKCVIFPKGKTTWDAFHRPFKDGDIVATKHGHFIGIVKVKNNIQVNTYCAIGILGSFSMNIAYRFERFATEEEKQKLFNAIKDNGYKWNPETKTLEKLPKFKVGDRIKFIYFDRKVAKVVKIHDKRYELDNGKFLEFQDENAYEISYDKFDISTLIPFENKVLCRNHCDETWEGDVFIRYADDCSDHQYYCIGALYDKCIPYEGNEHLLGKTNDCDEFYKTWK